MKFEEILHEKIRIDRAEIYVVDLEMKREFAISRGVIKTKTVPVIRLTGEGLKGFGEIPVLQEPIYSAEFLESTVDFSKIVLDQITGKEISIYELLEIHESYRGNNFAKSGIEFALWHLVLQKVGKGFFDFLKPSKIRFRLQSSIGIGSLEEIAAHVHWAFGKGIKAIKLKIKPGWSFEPVKFVKEKFAPEFISVDANGSFDPFNEKHWKEILDVSELVDEIEQPFIPKAIYMHSLLAKKTRAAVSLDESIETLIDFREAAELFDVIVNIKPPRIGGLFNSLKLAEEIKKRGLHAFIGGMLETTWGRIQNMVVASMPGVCDKFPGDFSPASEFYNEDLAEPPFEIKNGYIEVDPNAPFSFRFKEEKLQTRVYP